MAFEGIVATGFFCLGVLAFIGLGIGIVIFVTAMIVNSIRSSKLPLKLGNQDKLKRASDYELDAGLKDLIEDGKIDEAIQMYQRFTGLNIEYARVAINNLRVEMLQKAGR